MQSKYVKRFRLIAETTGDKIPSSIFKSSRDSSDCIKAIHRIEGNDFQEHFYIIYLNKSNKVVGYYVASKGGVCGTVCDPKLILKSIILSECTSIILSHNHPSGGLTPSSADEKLTKQLKAACANFDINIVDHIIITEESYYSFADAGLI